MSESDRECARNDAAYITILSKAKGRHSPNLVQHALSGRLRNNRSKV